MTKKKLEIILKSMQGLTYLEWSKIKIIIENSFKAEISNQNNKILIADSAKIINEYNREFELR